MKDDTVYAIRRVSYTGEGYTTLYLFRSKADAEQKVRELHIIWMEQLSGDWDFDIVLMEVW